MSEVNKVNVEILGETYTLKTDDDPDQVFRTAAMLNERMKSIAQSNPRLSPTKVAVMAALRLADDLIRLEQDYQHIIQILQEQN